MCGENLVALSTWTRAAGSSPRVRGKLNTLVCVRPPYGLIPACAGKTNEVETSVSVFGAHPRVCGENTRKAARHTLCPGSSPRVRGKPVGAEEVRSERRLIPACAGKTDRAEKSLALARAHPRVCGENTERSGVLTLRSVRSWKTLSFPPSLKVTHCRAFVQLSLSRIRL